MNSFFAAGLFDSPWVIVAIVIVSAVANWLSKRRAEKQADQSPEGAEPPQSSGKRPGEFNLEEAIRRLMGETTPAQSPVPPPIPREAREKSPPVPDWHEEEPFQPAKRTVSPLEMAQADITAIATAASERQVRDDRFEHLNEQGRHPATVVGRGRGHRSQPGSWVTSQWRDPRSARRAFVASLVFAPPKGLEP